MSSNWNEVQIKKKPISNEKKFSLLEILNKGGCIRCLNKSCKINDKHGIPYPDKLCTFVKNPIFIREFEKSINASNMDFNGKKPFYTICNYVNGKCRNCEEGRIKYISFNNEEIALCHPILENIRDKVTIGVHMDINLTLKGSQYEVTVSPIKVILPVEEIIEVDNVSFTEQNWPSIGPEKVNIDKKPNNTIDYSNLLEILKKLNSEQKPDEQLNLYEVFYETLYGDIKDTYNNVLRNSLCYMLRDTLKDSIDNNRCGFLCDVLCEKLSAMICNIMCSILYKGENIELYNLLCEILNKIQDKYVKKEVNEPIYEPVNEPIIVDNTVIESESESESESKSESKLYINNEIISNLTKQIADLKFQNEILKNKKSADTFIKNNNIKDVYEEILFNINNLNTNITKQFFDNNYSDYIIAD